MKNKNYLSIALIALCLFTTNVSRAAFAVKKEATKTEVVSQPARTTADNESAAPASSSESIASSTETKVVKKHSFFSNIVNRIKKSADAAIPEVLYIVLAIIGFGWLGMGINDNFGDFDWVLSLILYLIFYIPGLIYTLVKIGKYY